MLRVCLVILMFPALVIAAAAEKDEDPFNVDFFCGWDGYYRSLLEQHLVRSFWANAAGDFLLTLELT